MGNKSASQSDSTPRSYEEAKPARTKAAEPAAGYVATPPQKRALASRVIPAPEKVWQFARSNGLVSSLETTAQLVRESFRDLKEMTLSYEPDPEIENWEAVAINVKAGGSLDELQKQYLDCLQKILHAVPSSQHHQIDLLIVGVR